MRAHRCGNCEGVDPVTCINYQAELHGDARPVSDWWVEDDAVGDSTLWLRRHNQPDAPLAVLRECDLPAEAAYLWPLTPGGAA